MNENKQAKPRGKYLREEEFVTIKTLLKKGNGSAEIQKMVDRSEDTIRRVKKADTYQEYVQNNQKDSENRAERVAEQQRMVIPEVDQEELTPEDLEAFEEDDSWDSTNPPPANEQRIVPVVSRTVSPRLEGLLVRLIDDYLESGLHVRVHITVDDSIGMSLRTDMIEKAIEDGLFSISAAIRNSGVE